MPTEIEASPPAPGPTVDEVVEIVQSGLEMAVRAAGLCACIADRSAGRIHWRSAAWEERFGLIELLARHVPSSTELGELPLPPAGESWQRNRAMLLADGSEDLMELVLLGAETSGGSEYVTVLARERVGKGPVATDRMEVIRFIESALEDVSEGLLAVLYIDLDRFKLIYEQLGSVNASKVIEQVNRRLSSAIRATDILFRLPGDEFVIVASELAGNDAVTELAERLRNSVATMTEVADGLSLTASVGAAIADNEQTGEAVFGAAETAVHLAKGRGRNRTAIQHGQPPAQSERLIAVERQLARAIADRNVRFAYQPVVSIDGGTIVGAEALLRLGGEVGLSAMEVVTAAEHAGMMGQLGALVVDGVDNQLGYWLRTSGEDLTAMVNLAASQLLDPLLREAMLRLTDKGYPGGSLAVEIGESVARARGDEVLDLMSSVGSLFQLGLDGFGLAEGSLTEFNNLGVSYVKMHRSVVGQLVEDESQRRRMIRLLGEASGLGIDVIALGVESNEQAELLAELGCTKAQGFLYAGALNATELLDVLGDGSLNRSTSSGT